MKRVIKISPILLDYYTHTVKMFPKKIFLNLIIFVKIIISFNISANELKFNWGNSRAEVTETISKSNQVVTYRYTLTSTFDGVFYQLDQNNFKVLEINYQEIDNIEIDQYFSKIIGLPSIKIDKHGEFIEVINFEKYLNGFISNAENPEEIDMYKSPVMRQGLNQRVMDKWCYWVCSWTDNRISKSNSLQKSTEVDFSGTKLPINITITHHGQLNDIEKYVKLTMESVISGKELVKAIQGFVAELGQEINSTQEEIDSAQGSKTTNIEIITDPNTLKPVRIEVNTKTIIKTIAEEQEQVEKIKFKFRWIN